MTTHRFAALTFAILFGIATHAAAQAGQLDPTFGNNGIFTTTLSTGFAVALQADGKIVFAGEASIASSPIFRLNSNGTLDSTFGTGGEVQLTPPGRESLGVFALAVQSDGKILVAANDNGILLARLTSTVAADASFGQNGFSTTVAVQSVPFSGGMVLQSDGNIVVVGGGVVGTATPSAIARFTSAGQLDSSFGVGGVANLVYGGPTQVALQADGKILVTSGPPVLPFFFSTFAPPVAQQGTLTRYNKNGSLDATFGTVGTASSLPSASALTVQSDGRILVAGGVISKRNLAPNPTDLGFGILRYLSNGSIDSSFGTGGVAITDFGANNPDAAAFALALQANGDIVAAGTAAVPNDGSFAAAPFALARYTSAGKLDTHGCVIRHVQ